MPKKKKQTNWGNYYRTDEEYKAFAWCIRNDIKIGVMPAEHGPAPSKYYIEIMIGQKNSRDPKIYESTEVWEQIYKYYTYYYEKYRDTVS